MPDVAVTLGGLLTDAATTLRSAGIAEPAREALRLWEGLESVAPGHAFLHRGEMVDDRPRASFERAVARRAAGEPLAYVTGLAGFRSLTLAVDQRVLIPRPETEGLVELVLGQMPTGVAADIGTGSGCIALSLALEGAYTAVVAVDLSADALALAERNAVRAGAGIRFEVGDLTGPLAVESVDVLVSNPPYLTTAEYAGLDAAVRDWEPALALISGADGLDATRRLLDEGRRVMRAGGLMAIEVDSARARPAAALAERLGWRHVVIHMDLFGRERFLLARRSKT